jgi:lysophospholipase L1-like esterase
MKIAPNSKLLFIGDSITDCGRARPVGEGTYGALGNGYVNLIAGLISATYPQSAIRIVNMGISGNTVRDLKNRWQTDVIEQKPDWLSIMIGINDVWRQFDNPLQKEWQVDLKEYTSTLEELVQHTRPSLKGLVVMSPYFIDLNRIDRMRMLMDRYGEVDKQIAEKYSAIFVDTQSAFDIVLQHLHPMTVAMDRVHPDITGHTILARALLKAIEFEW